jgi:hypothetical protein
LKNIEKAVEIQPISEMNLAFAYIHAKAGRRAPARRMLALSESDRNRLDYTDAATASAAFGDRDEAFEHLDEAFEKGDTSIVLLKIDPRFENLREDPRFESLLHRLNLV